MEKIQEIPGKMYSEWIDEVRAVVDIWQSYSISLEDFREAVLVKGVNYAKERNGQAWIVDSSKAKGVFPQEIQDFIGSTVFPSFVDNGIKFFITIKPETRGLTSLTVANYSAKAGPAGMQLVDLQSVEDAVMWLKEHGE